MLHIPVDDWCIALLPRGRSSRRTIALSPGWNVEPVRRGPLPRRGPFPRCRHLGTGTGGGLDAWLRGSQLPLRETRQERTHRRSAREYARFVRPRGIPQGERQRAEGALSEMGEGGEACKFGTTLVRSNRTRSGPVDPLGGRISPLALPSPSSGKRFVASETTRPASSDGVRGDEQEAKPVPSAPPGTRAPRPAPGIQ